MRLLLGFFNWCFGKVVEWDSTLSLLYYQQEGYKGFGTNSTTGGYVVSGTNAITGGTSGDAGTTTGNTETVTLLNSNSLSLTSGYDKSRVTSDTGNINYFENRKPIQRVKIRLKILKLL